MNGDPILYELLNKLQINYQYIEHPPAPTIEIAKQYWDGNNATHCKNIFMRNHKGNQHYLIILPCDSVFLIKNLEQNLKQGKLTFASEDRLYKYLKLTPGSVSPFGLINDSEHHVIVYIDEALAKSEHVSFHPNINTASLIISFSDLINFLIFAGSKYQILNLGANSKL
ncbi:MAG: prolyl-tRNA synthetase associated domain-containing protein [Bacteroidota bacterium]